MPQIGYKVTLTGERNGKGCKGWPSGGRQSSQSLLNALILLACDEGSLQERKRTAGEIAAILPVSRRKIDRVKRGFVEQGLGGGLAESTG